MDIKPEVDALSKRIIKMDHERKEMQNIAKFLDALTDMRTKTGKLEITVELNDDFTSIIIADEKWDGVLATLGRELAEILASYHRSVIGLAREITGE